MPKKPKYSVKPPGFRGKFYQSPRTKAGGPREMRTLRQGDSRFKAWTLSRLQEDPRQMGVGISAFCHL